MRKLCESCRGELSDEVLGRGGRGVRGAGEMLEGNLSREEMREVSVMD
jgi:hypothetical protein